MNLRKATAIASAAALSVLGIAAGSAYAASHRAATGGVHHSAGVARAHPQALQLKLHQTAADQSGSNDDSTVGDDDSTDDSSTGSSGSSEEQDSNESDDDSQEESDDQGEDDQEESEDSQGQDQHESDDDQTDEGGQGSED